MKSMDMPAPAARHHVAITERKIPAATCHAVEVVRDVDALLRLQHEWDALVDASQICHPFLRHTWLCNWWHSFGAGRELHVLLFRQNDSIGKIVAIVPLMLERVNLFGIPCRKMTFLHNDHTPRTGIIGGWDPDHGWQLLWNYLHTQFRQWDVLELGRMNEEAPGLNLLSTWSREAGYLTGVWQGEVSPYLPFRDGWEKRISHTLRTNLRQRMNRLKRCGNVELQIVATPPLVEQALADGFRIEAAAWKARAGTAISVLPDVKQFYAELAASAAADGSLRLLFLTLDGKRIAFAYALCLNKRLFVLKSGYDPQYACYSPYNQLCHMVLKECQRSGLEEYDFLGGNDVWKRYWTAHARAHVWLYVFAPGWRSYLVYRIKFIWIPSLRKLPFYHALRTVFLVVLARKKLVPRRKKLPPRVEIVADGSTALTALSEPTT